MTQKNRYVLDATKPTYLRVGIKWDPLERDNIDEEHSIGSPRQARMRLEVIAKRLKWLKFGAVFLRLTLALKFLAKDFDNEIREKRAKQAALQQYLKHEKLHSFDLDLCCFCYGQDGRLVGFVLPDFTEMYGTAQFHPAFLHSGNDTTGTGDMFDEEVLINLHGIDAGIHQVFILVVSQRHGFDRVKGGSWSLITTKDEKEIMSTALKTEKTDRLHVIAKLARNGTSWDVIKVAAFCPLAEDKKVPVQHRIDKLLTGSYVASGNTGNQG